MVLQYSGLLSEDGQVAVRDPLDKCIDVALKRAHKATAMAIKASAITSIVSQASIVWLRKLSQLIPQADKSAQRC